MYHQTLPVPRELETEILKSSDAKGIFSYLTTHTDVYQRSLDPDFWWNFDYYLFQEIFLEAAKHKSYEMIISMLDERRIDTYYRDQVRSKFIADNDYVGMSIVGSVYDRISADELKEALKNKDPENIVELFEYLDAALPDIPLSEILWLYSGNSGSIFESEIEEQVADSLLRLRRYQDFDELVDYRRDIVGGIIYDRSRGRQEYEGFPLFTSIAGYADYDYYQDMEESDPYSFNLQEGATHFNIIIDPKIYREIYERRREKRLHDYGANGNPVLANIYRFHAAEAKQRYYELLEVGFALKPDEWIELFTDVDPEDQDELLRNLVQNAYDYGFENFGDVISDKYNLY